MGHPVEARWPQSASPVTISYREFAPATALADLVRTYFSVMPNGPRTGRRTITREVLVTRDEPINLPMLADPRTSLTLDVGATWHVNGGWSFGGPLEGRVIGPNRLARQPAADIRPAMIGAYLEPGAAMALPATWAPGPGLRALDNPWQGSYVASSRG